MIRIGLMGYCGRMGQLIAEQIAASDTCMLAGGVDRDFAPEFRKREGLLLTTHADEVISICDVVIDFSTVEAVPEHARLAVTHGKSFMTGVTGLDEKGIEALKHAAQHVPVLYARNTSLSLAATKRIVSLAAKLLAPFDYDIAILDEHHRAKRDAPSGTALALGEAAMAGNNGAKQPSYAAIRAGYIVGEHETVFAGAGEVIRIRHSVTERAVFARGALQSALWLHGKPKGFYGMDDVLGI